MIQLRDFRVQYCATKPIRCLTGNLATGPSWNCYVRVLNPIFSLGNTVWLTSHVFKLRGSMTLFKTDSLENVSMSYLRSTRNNRALLVLWHSNKSSERTCSVSVQLEHTSFKYGIHRWRNLKKYKLHLVATLFVWRYVTKPVCEKGSVQFSANLDIQNFHPGHPGHPELGHPEYERSSGNEQKGHPFRWSRTWEFIQNIQKGHPNRSSRIWEVIRKWAKRSSSWVIQNMRGHPSVKIATLPYLLYVPPSAQFLTPLHSPWNGAGL